MPAAREAGRDVGVAVAAAILIAWTLRIVADAALLPPGTDPMLRAALDAAAKIAIFVVLPLVLVRTLPPPGPGGRARLAWALALGWPLLLLAVDRGLLGRTHPLLPAAPSLAFALAALSLLITAASEEFAFRRVLMARFAARYGPAAAIGGSALLFALVHWPGWIVLSGLDLAGLMIPTAQILVFGAMLGLVAWLAGSIRPAIAMHVLNNLVAGALS